MLRKVIHPKTKLFTRLPYLSQVPSDDRVTIKLDKFDVEPSMTCEFDYMEVTAEGYYKK